MPWAKNANHLQKVRMPADVLKHKILKEPLYLPTKTWRFSPQYISADNWISSLRLNRSSASRSDAQKTHTTCHLLSKPLLTRLSTWLISRDEWCAAKRSQFTATSDCQQMSKSIQLLSEFHVHSLKHPEITNTYVLIIDLPFQSQNHLNIALKMALR